MIMVGYCSCEQFIRQCLPGVRRIERRRSRYATSHRLDEVDAEMTDGRVRRLMLKSLGSAELLTEARGTRPAFLMDPWREPIVYTQLLRGRNLGTAHFYGCGADAAGNRWILLERVPGMELFQVGDRALWEDAARWLARLHGSLDCQAEDWMADRLIRYTADHYWIWLARAVQFSPRARPLIQRLTRHWDELVDRLLSLPTGVVHGEFYASNVLVVPDSGRPRVCAVDWEMAGVGPRLLDLAALTSGWQDPDCRAMVRAYADGLEDHGQSCDVDDLMAGLADCRLFLAVRWLGWSRGWTPPPQHAHDWLEVAREQARQKGW